MKKIKSAKEITVILDNIRSAHNVGAIFRTADAGGVKKIYLCGITPSPDEKQEILKTSLGAERYLKWEKIKEIWRLLENLKKQGFFIIAVEQGGGSENLFKIKKIPKKKIALLLGSEIKGLSPRILERADRQIEIPMDGKKESLNVSVAFGIVVYQIRNLL